MRAFALQRHEDPVSKATAGAPPVVLFLNRCETQATFFMLSFNATTIDTVFRLENNYTRQFTRENYYTYNTVCCLEAY